MLPASKLRYFTLILGLLSVVAACPDRQAKAEHQLLSPLEMNRLGLTEVWRRQLSVPAGAQSIVDHKMYVHQSAPKEYVEVVQASGDTKPKADSPTATDAEPTIYSRYLLHPEASAENEIALREQRDTGPALGLTGSSTFRSKSMAATQRLASRLNQVNFHTSGMLDRAEAERRGRNDIRKLKRSGIEAELSSRQVPRIRLYTLADDGTVECRDGETGELVWLRRVGHRHEGYSGLGIDDLFVTIINGGEAIKLDVKNGEEVDILRLRYVPTAGSIHCGEYALVPSIGNRIVAYPLVNLRRDTFAEMVAGSSLGLPTHAIGSNKAAWGTSRGFVYVIEMDGNPNVQFRLNTDGLVNGPPVAAPGERFFFGSETGQIYGIKATRSGQVLWSRPSGEPIYDTPYFVDEKVLFRGTYGNLICVNAKDGSSVWGGSKAGVSKVLAVLNGKIYTRSLSGSLIVLNLEDGSTLESFAGLIPEILEVNRFSNRLYFTNLSGAVQCVRPDGAEMPILRVMVEPQADEGADAEKEKQAKQDAQSTGNDPFAAGGGDPFGAGGGDPFGGGDAKDPFAPAGGGDDPFAPSGGADPFGDSPF